MGNGLEQIINERLTVDMNVLDGKKMEKYEEDQTVAVVMKEITSNIKPKLKTIHQFGKAVGISRAWNCAKEILSLSEMEREIAFGYSDLDIIFHTFSYEQATKKLIDYRNNTNYTEIIAVGAEIKLKNVADKRGMVIKKDINNNAYVDFQTDNYIYTVLMEDTSVVTATANDLILTGRKYNDMTEFTGLFGGC